jgi:ABC-type bacteriocin/lantibiotic exporter with double-glycine peptidase domain
MESGQVLLPAVLTVLITWVGATRVLHHSLQAGQLVAFFGYATFLTLPLRTVIEYIIASTRAVVGARKVIAVLSTQPAVTTPVNPLPWPTDASVLRDPISKVAIPLGQFVGLVTETPAAAQHIIDQLTRFDVDSQATLDDVPLSAFALKDVRSNLVVSEIEPRMFAGTLRSEIALAGERDDASIEAALFTAGADDILTSADDGLSVRIEERGRNFSGGQRQRLALARAVATDANVLLLIEPTSAVDAHTESRIATRLVEARRGRSTVVSTTSPLLLEHCDVVIFVEPSGEVVAGTHRELASSSTTYRAAILRSDFA